MSENYENSPPNAISKKTTGFDCPWKPVPVSFIVMKRYQDVCMQQ